MTDKDTLTVRVDDGEETRREARERIEAMERGEALEDRHVLVLEDEAALERLFRPANIELLRAIRREEPESMRETADVVDRGFKEVHRNLTELAELNVIELIDEGRAKRPVVRFDDMEVEVSFDTVEGDPAPA